ncbi:hypothetical protein [Prosthecobacter sp.]
MSSTASILTSTLIVGAASAALRHGFFGEALSLLRLFLQQSSIDILCLETADTPKTAEPQIDEL